MKRGLFIALIASIMLAGTTTAQNKSQQNGKTQMQAQTAEQIARQKTDKQTKELSLNSDQAEKLYQANLQDAKAHHKMRENKRNFEEQQRAEMQKHKEQLRTSAGKILTPEQYAKWEASEKAPKHDGEVKQSHRKGYNGKPMGCRGKCNQGKQPRHDKNKDKHQSQSKK